MSFYKIHEILHTIYGSLPKDVREFLSPVVEPAFSYVKRTLFIACSIRFSVYLLKGKEKCGSSSLTTLFFSSLFFGEGKLLYLVDLLYSEEPVKESLGKVSIWKVKSKLSSDISKADLVFIGTDELFSGFLSRQGFTIIPQWILFMRDLSKPSPEIDKLSRTNSSLKRDLKRIRKHKYSYEMTHDPAKFKYFYHHMYLRYIPKRFGKLSLLGGFHYMKLTFEKGQLLLVKQGSDYVAGNIIVTHNGRAFSSCFGIREGNIEYLRQGALAATYYFTILWTKERGYESCDFGHCRPFLDDGVSRYKKKWGMEIERSKRNWDIFAMKICNFSLGAHDFLTKNPFIFIDQDKLKGLILAEQDHPLSSEEVQSLFKTYHIPGLDCLVVVSPQGFTQQAEEFASSHPTKGLHLVNMLPNTVFTSSPLFLNPEPCLIRKGPQCRDAYRMAKVIQRGTKEE